MHNKRLRDRRLRNKGLKDDEDPLVCEDVASDNEWFIDDETDLSLSDLQLEDLSVDVLRGEADQGGASTSATPHTSTSSAAKGKRKVGIIEDDEDLNFIDTIGEEDSLEDPFSYNFDFTTMPDVISTSTSDDVITSTFQNDLHIKAKALEAMDAKMRIIFLVNLTKIMDYTDEISSASSPDSLHRIETVPAQSAPGTGSILKKRCSIYMVSMVSMIF
ncbi:hypothetical protein M5K25_014178 [Dendrobium thyrsiflorum]|uniref:Uncharacterized protein n=1 Tax=Dendrobium thyrsiflorum TaxID=117978 RepID=A0ABD0UVM2_DENTH